MLTELTTEQTLRMHEFEREWIAIGLSTDPANRAEAERGVVEAYASAKLAPPTAFIWQGSPLTGVIAASLLARGKATPKNIDDEVNAFLTRSRNGTVTKDEKSDIRDRVRWGSKNGSLSGQHEAGWLSFYDFFGRATTPELAKIVDPLQGVIRVAKNAGWWWPFENAVVLTERPVELHQNERRRMHRMDGPAISYPDGFKLYFVNGVRVPEHVIERPSDLTSLMVRDEENVEVRRVMIDAMGDRYLKESNAQLIHEDVDELGYPRKLWRCEVPDDEAFVMIEVVNSTPEPDGSSKTYFLRVPPNTERVPQGLAWMAQVPEEEYVLTVQT